MIKIFKLIIFTFLIMILVSCHSENKQRETSNVINVTKEPITTTLFYSGTVLPIKTVVITSPADGVIDGMPFFYGDKVKKGQLLFTISSDKFQTDYKTALMAYIKAKNDFSDSQSQLSESDFLHKNQLISSDEFKTKRTAYYNSQLALTQAKDALSVLIKQINLQGLNIYNLSIADINKISQALNMQDGALRLQILAPTDGFALLPIKSDSTDAEGKKIEKGDQVKQGDVLAVIGNLDGIEIKVNVNEFNINQLRLGQKVKITGVAFPDFVLEGKITGIDKQGQVSQGGMPTFPIEIIVPKLTDAERKIIHVGMSAKAEIVIDEAAQITVPIAAVFSKHGETFVKKIDPQSQKIVEIAVKTGASQENSVVIETNLKAGDKVVVPN